MVFSNALFIFLFLPLVTGLYYLADRKYGNYILLVASILFYSVGEPRFIFVMIMSIIANYFFAWGISIIINNRVRKILLICDIVLNVGLLFVYKYLDFGIRMINKMVGDSVPEVGMTLPIGISFFTFQAISYVVDVYRRDVTVQKNPFWVALYISFFPQLIAGPIVRYQTIANQIMNRRCTYDQYCSGVSRFVIGLAKKVIIANNVAVVSEFVFNPGYVSENGIVLWLGAICFSLQIYFDFSGYSDMAIGLGRMFGFEFQENFDYPYISKSITDFWRRWHISLSEWFRDYVYIPLGGSRVNVGRHIFNMFIVWILTGLWHGANYTFVFWGLWYFILLVIEKYIIKPERFILRVMKIVWRIITLMLVIVGWVIFNAPSLGYAIHYIINMFGIGNVWWTIDNQVIRLWGNYGCFVLGGLLLSTPIVPYIKGKIENKNTNNWEAFFYNFASTVVYVLLGMWSLSYIVLGSHNPFIYLNF